MARLKERSIEHFAAIPVSVMVSTAYRTLPARFKEVLWLLAAQYRGNNNGDLALTRKQARHFGLNNERTRTHGLRELEARGLIIKTRQGGISYGGRQPTLWALSWKPVNSRDGKELQLVSRPSNDWKQWRELDTQHGTS
jgi:hypothetical protein